MTLRDPMAELLRGLEPPQPPSGLRRRALTAAQLRREIPSDPWFRLWSSPTWRIVWVASVLILLAGHLILSLPDRQSAKVQQTTLVIVGAATQGELAELVDLPRLDIDHLPRLDDVTVRSVLERNTNDDS